MYIPAHFEEPSAETLHRFIGEHPLGTLVVHGPEGLGADHVPLSLRAGEGPHGKLLGHVARANPLWRAAAVGIDCLVVFHGAQHYISPNGYASKAQTGRVVPTWNYEVVHVRGRLHAIDDPAWLRRFLEEFTSEHERTQAKPWRIDDAPEDYIARMLENIVGIEVEIASMAGKAKLSQNQPPANRSSLIDALRAAGDFRSNEMAGAIERRMK